MTAAVSLPGAVDEARAFLSVLFGDDAPGYLALWTKSETEKRTHWFRATELERAAVAGVNRADAADVYVGMGLHPQPLGAGQRGTAESVIAIPGVWLDIDIRGPAHKGENLPPSLEAARELVSDFPLVPTVVVHSGHGVQLYWLYHELWTLESQEERQAAQRLTRDFQTMFQGIAGKRGWTVDATHDLSRVLRLPGTFNRKVDPQPVRTIKVRPDVRYGLEDFDPFLPPVDATPARREPAGAVVGAIADGARNSTLTSLAGTMRRRGMTEDAIIAALKAENAARCSPPMDESEVETIARSVARYEPNGNGAPSTYEAIVPTVPTFRLYTDREIEAMPKPSFLVDNLLPAGGLLEMHGPPGAGKSFLALDFALCVASGHHFIGHPVEQGPVIYVVAEGASAIGARVLAWREAKSIHRELPIRFLTEPVQLLELAHVHLFLNALRETSEAPALIVFDTLARCFIGGDENSAHDMGRAIAALDYIRRRTLAAVFPIHHTRKDGETERGSTALRGACDTMIAVRQEEGEVEITCDKQKDAPPFSTMRLTLAPVRESCVLSPMVPVRTHTLTPKQLRVLQALQYASPDASAASTVWLKCSQVSDSTFYLARTVLIQRGYVRQVTKGWRELNELTSSGHEMIRAHSKELQ